jgi:wyosine [tRNA(Phe)-imidazoG37] synthetase (radical SAM superfamily)
LRLTNTRQDYFAPEEILEEIERALPLSASQLDAVTFVGEGEPTLYRSLGSLIRQVKARTSLPVAVITNGSLLCLESVQQELATADVVMPSLDAADQKTYRAVNRPYGRLRITEIIEGMVRFRKIFEGRLWLETMLVRGLNDGEEVLLEIRRAVERIAPDRIDINIPVRPPAEKWVRPPEARGLVMARDILGDAVFMEREEVGSFGTVGFMEPMAAVEWIVRRHPMRRSQILDTLGRFNPEELHEAMKTLEASGRIQKITYRRKVYYVSADAWHAPEGRKAP